MRKIFSLLLLFTLFAPPASAGDAPRDESTQDFTDGMATYTLTVTFLDLETRKDAPSLLTVKLPQGETMTLEAEPYCRFIDDRQQDLSPSDFGKRHKGKKVTIDFMEREPEIFVILECRSGTA